MDAVPSNTMMPNANPTASVDLDFAHYVANRDSDRHVHMVGEVPNYSFALDGTLRQRLAAMGPIRSIAQVLVSASAPLYRQIHQMHSLMVGPSQYEDIYAISAECARRLGIGIPQVFIAITEEPNSFTLASDDITPVIVLTKRLVELLDRDELGFVIGHECGHIHNLHGVYNTAVEMLVNPTAQVVLRKLLSGGMPLGVVRTIATALQGSLRLFLLNWSRCAEITCDRAGLICCGDVAHAERALIKLLVGDGELLKQFNMQAFLNQAKQGQSLMGIWMEMRQTHPLMAKRIEGLRIFAETETFFQWRPDMQDGHTALHTKADADRKCEQIMSRH